MTIEVENKTVRECLDQPSADLGNKNSPLQDVDEMDSIHYNKPINKKHKAVLETAGITASPILADSPESVKPAVERDVHMDEKNLITTAEVAKILDVTPRTVAKWRERKLFGVPFFTADVMKNGAWFYYRERVEQLKAVYHKGILGNMYKLARKFEGVEFCPFDICGTSEGHLKISKVEPKYFPSDEVAQILGVNEKTIDRWRENGKFVEDMQDHDGVYWYSAARVYAKKAELDAEKKAPIQQFENLPDYILNLPNFFECGVEGDPKKPRVKWGDPVNLKKYTDIKISKAYETAGFNIAKTGLLVVDIDHCLDSSGSFVNLTVQSIVDKILDKTPTYGETSMSGRGLHFVFKPQATDIEKVNAALDLGDGCKVEFFCTHENRSIHFTGKTFGCEPKALISADISSVRDLLTEIAGRQITPQLDDSENVGDTDTARELLKNIPCPHNGENYSLWLNVGMALHHNGNDFEDWLNWSRTTEPTVNENELRQMWKCFNKPCHKPITIATLYKLAMDNGYKPNHTQARKNNLLEKLKALKAKPASQARDSEMRRILNQAIDKAPRSGKRIALSTANNAHLIFTYDPLIDGLFGYNQFLRKIQFLKKPSWNNETEEWQDSDDAELRLYLRGTYADFSGSGLIDDCIVSYSRKNTFHPIKKYLENLKWDGTKRAEEMFIKYLRADDNEYTRIITRYWLLAAVCRIYYVGCNFQWALTLQGAQSIGKSYLLETLGGQWAIKLTDTLDDSHAIDTIQEAWIAEIEEWAGGRKAEVNAQKSFLSRATDTVRLPYERRAVPIPRHSVFCVTVNDFSFLRDKTGNRRFKILQCHNDKFQHGEDFTADTAGQIWAEVMTWFNEMFQDGFDSKKLELPKEIEKQAEEIAQGYVADDGTADEIYTFINTPIPRQIIWQLMTKDERRKFFIDGSVAFDETDLLNRYESLSPKWKKLLDENELNQEIENRKMIRNSNNEILFYGKELRQTICAGEISYECFSGKKPMSKINDALRQLEDWQPAPRLRDKDIQYQDQKAPYERVASVEMPSQNAELGFADDEFEGAIPDSALPF